MSKDVYTIEEIRDKAKELFDDKQFVDKVYLFGSYAKNSATPKSDLDFVVILNAPIGMKLYSLYDEINDVFGKKSDILTEKEIMKLMPNTYKRDRVLVYERQGENSFSKNDLPQLKKVIEENVEKEILENPYKFYDGVL